MVVGTVLGHGTTVAWYYRNPSGTAALVEPGSLCNPGKTLQDAIENMWVQRVCMCDDSTHHSTADPLLIVRFSYDSITKRKTKEKLRLHAPSTEGKITVLCYEYDYLNWSLHTVNPQMYCHQSLKPTKGKYALSISHFFVYWWQHKICTIYK